MQGGKDSRHSILARKGRGSVYQPKRHGLETLSRLASRLLKAALAEAVFGPQSSQKKHG